MSYDNRFDLEYAITSCWNTCEDLKLLSSKVAEGGLDKDELFNALLGVEQLHELRCERVFSIFEEMVRRGNIS